MPLVEIVRTDRTADDVVRARLTSSPSKLGKTPILCPDTPGFAATFLLIPLLNDCVRVLDETGVTPEDLDEGMKHGAGWPMGPCALARPRGRRRARARERGAVREAARAADGAAGAARPDAEGRASSAGRPARGFTATELADARSFALSRA